MNDQPKVFGDGDVTICLSKTGKRLFIGQKEITKAYSIMLSSSDGSCLLEIYFPKSNDIEDQQLIEEDIRVCSLISWLHVIKE